MPTDRDGGAPAASVELLSRPEDIAIRNRGLQVLGAHMTKIADSVVVSLQASEPIYRRSPGEIQMAKSGDHVIKSGLLPPAERAGTMDWPTQVGRRRAHQGVPTDAVRRAYHIGGQVLFNAFMEWAAEEELPRERSIPMANDLWNVVDLHFAAASAALRATEDEMFGSRRAGEMLDALLAGDNDRDCVAGVARAWGWAERARYAVVVQRPDRGALPVAQAELPATVAGVAPVWRVQSGYAIGVVALGDVPVTAIARALTVRPGRRTGFSLVVDNLADLGRARRIAELAAHAVMNDNGVVCIEAVLPAAVLPVWPDLTDESSLKVLAPVLALDGPSRNLLLDTLAAWLAAGGSADQAAAALFCHRNTVLNRVRRLEQLTQKSLFLQADLVELGLALEAFHQCAAYI